MKKILLYISGLLTLLWGITHLFPTAGIVKGFGDVSAVLIIFSMRSNQKTNS